MPSGKVISLLRKGDKSPMARRKFASAKVKVCWRRSEQLPSGKVNSPLQGSEGLPMAEVISLLRKGDKSLMARRKFASAKVKVCWCRNDQLPDGKVNSPLQGREGLPMAEVISLLRKGDKSIMARRKFASAKVKVCWRRSEQLPDGKVNSVLKAKLMKKLLVEF